MKAKKMFMGLVLPLLAVTPALAQRTVTIDANSLIKRITILPATIEELHSAFTVYTRHGEEFDLAGRTDPPYLQFKHLVRTLHDSAIRAIMKKNPRKDMVDTVQYEDERWKLALRPLLGPDIKARLSNVNSPARATILQIFDMQGIFDWMDFYAEEEKIKKYYRAKLASVSREGGTIDPKATIQYETEQYEKRQQLWMLRYTKYTKALTVLQRLLEEVDYGAKINLSDKTLSMHVLADVETRALEALEKLVWSEMSIAISGELAYNSKRILSMYGELKTP